MNDLDPITVIPVECVLAAYLYDHPGVIVAKGDTYFVFDSKSGEFRYHKPKNKVMNGWYRAGGLHGWFNSIFRLYAEYFGGHDARS